MLPVREEFVTMVSFRHMFGGGGGVSLRDDAGDLRESLLPSHGNEHIHVAIPAKRYLDPPVLICA